MYEHASRFAYQAHRLQRTLTRIQLLRGRQRLRVRVRYLGDLVFSGLLDLLVGYGYRPQRAFAAYAGLIVGFGLAYYLLGPGDSPPLTPTGALVLSVTSFHGRGFFPSTIGLDDPTTVLSAFEALVGLVVEVSLIAAFTQRFFGR